jgi:hypothetical protein
VERPSRSRSRARPSPPSRTAAATAAAAAIAATAVSLPGDGTTAISPGPATASAAERAAAILSPPPGSIVHDVATYRSVAPDGSLSTWREQSWRQTSRPYTRRQVTTRDGVRAETATVANGDTRLYDATTNTIYTNPPDAGPSLGTPAPAGDGDPLRRQMANLLRSGDARIISRSRAVVRFAYENPLPDGRAVKWTYVINARTYEPIRLTAASPDGSRVTTQFQTYETLDATADERALLSLRAQHPDATVDRSETGYLAAQSRIYGR